MEKHIVVRWHTPLPNSGYELLADGVWLPVEQSRILAWLARGGMVRYEQAAGFGAA